MDAMMAYWRGILLAVVAIASFGIGSIPLNGLERRLAPDQLDVVIAPPVQVMLAGGDRYLAANLAIARLTVLNVLQMDKRDYPILAKLHQTSSFLHPCQEDNYYLAQAFLPWIGDVASTDGILKAAADCRTWDVQPVYYLGFNAFYFHKDYRKAAAYYHDAAPRGTEQQKDQLLNMAAKFYERGGEDISLAAEVIRKLKDETANPKLKAFLEARAVSVEILIFLREAAARYRELKGRPLSQLQELVDARLVDTIPPDPIGRGYEVDGQGEVQLAEKKVAEKK